MGSLGAFLIVSQKGLIVERNGQKFGTQGWVFCVYRVFLTVNVQVQFGVIQCISDLNFQGSLYCYSLYITGILLTSKWPSRSSRQLGLLFLISRVFTTEVPSEWLFLLFEAVSICRLYNCHIMWIKPLQVYAFPQDNQNSIGNVKTLANFNYFSRPLKCKIVWQKYLLLSRRKTAHTGPLPVGNIIAEWFDQQWRTHVINAWGIQLTLIFQCYMIYIQSTYLWQCLRHW